MTLLGCYLRDDRTYLYTYTHASTSMSACGVSIEALLSCPDLLESILRHLDHSSFAALGRVCWSARVAERAAVRANPALLAVAARNGGRAFTKSACMGWFALTSCEADTLPRSMHARTRPGGGFYYLYHDSAFGGAVAILSARRSTWAKRRASTQPVQSASTTQKALKRARIGG